MSFTHQFLEKNKKIDPYERSTLQLLSIAVRNEKNNKLVFPTTQRLTRPLKKKNLFSSMLKTFIF